MKLTFIVFILQLICFSTIGQTQVSLFGEVGVPVGDFRENTKAEGYGFGLGVAVPIERNNAIFLGANLNYEIYGKRFGQDTVDDLEIITNNNMFMMHAFLRLKPVTNGKIGPYLDVLGGFKYLYTRTKIKESILSDPLEANTEFKDFVWGYGGAIGLQYSLDYWVALDLSASLLKSGEAEYLDSKGISEDASGNLILDPTKSKTDIAIFRVGVTIELDHSGNGL